jgi:ATF/CREB family transcription factor
MLSGPTNDYFGDSAHLRGGFPTPNESSLRTGLTPGGGGSMFPVPSPGGAALFLQSGGATPSTVDFHRTALSAAAAAKRIDPLMHQSITSQPQDMLNGIGTRPMETTQPVEAPGQHDANDAANGLFMLASQSRTGSQPAQYTMPHPQPVHAHSHVNNAMMGGQSADTSPVTANRNHSISVVSTNSGRGQSEGSDESEHKSRPTTRGRGKKGPAAQTNGRRKTEDGPSSKAPAAKKAKGNSGHAMSVEPEPLSEEEPDLSKDEYNANGKKMTDEEKRKNFLERNR